MIEFNEWTVDGGREEPSQNCWRLRGEVDMNDLADEDFNPEEEVTMGDIFETELDNAEGLEMLKQCDCKIDDKEINIGDIWNEPVTNFRGKYIEIEEQGD